MTHARPQIRAEVAALPAYKPGKKPATSGRPVKLSSNENPFPPLDGVLAEATACLEGLNRYPDIAAVELRTALAESVGLGAGNVALGAGSVAVLYHLLSAVCEPGSEVVYAWRSFEAYPIAAGIAGARSVQVPLRPDATHDLDAMLAAVNEKTRVVIVCSPNNPTGTVADRREFELFLAALPRDVVCVLDEAYVEFVRGSDIPEPVHLLAQHENLVVLRTFSKAYGLAGLRVGYSLASEELTEAMAKTAIPFGVTQLAQTAALVSLGRTDDLRDRVDAIVEERDRVAAALRGLGLAVPDAQGNFVWLALGDAASDFAGTCELQGVAVRPFDGEGVRVTVGTVDENDRLIALAEQWAGAPVGATARS
ncbi:histidinol-phosphate transaminase [Aeromicrobium fastidiosum]|uniref:Aromatic amino acid aminotransferase n=2 Tax=Aeromicrobium fastidiosum TaxID=52699 RepID=A0A641AJ18_9ACTN|nr:histidinol-phosphate transaminase [Aeromicrobium fastidiosum]